MVLVFDCPRDTALSRFIERSRESGDDRNMFDKRYAEFERNHQVIVERYSELVKHLRERFSSGQSRMSLTYFRLTPVERETICTNKLGSVWSLFLDKILQVTGRERGCLRNLQK